MDLTKKEIAELFSRGDFERTYPYLSEKIEWNVIKNFECKGRKEVIEQCEKTAKYFESITTDFKQLDVIENDNKVAITGTAELSENGKRIEFISACDVYEFDNNEMLQKITSYCLVEKDGGNLKSLPVSEK